MNLTICLPFQLFLFLEELSNITYSSSLTLTVVQNLARSNQLNVSHFVIQRQLLLLRCPETPCRPSKCVPSERLRLAEVINFPLATYWRMCKSCVTYLLTTTTDNYDKLGDELNFVESWAKENNMSSNKTKTKEIIFRTSRMNQPIPQPLDAIQRVISLKLLQDHLSMNENVNSLI